MANMPQVHQRARKLEVGEHATSKVRALRPAGNLEQLSHDMGRYHWNIVGQNFKGMSTYEGPMVYFSEEEDRHEYGLDFL